MKKQQQGTTFFHNLKHHPRRLLLRRAMFQVHLWLGLLLSLYIVLIALSGAVLVYRDTLVRTVVPRGLSVYDPAHVASVSAVVASAQRSLPGAKVSYIHLPSERLPVFELQMSLSAGQPVKAVADSASGKVFLLQRNWLDLVYDFHTELLLARHHGMQWNGVGAAGLLILALTGVLLWWRGLKSWWHALFVSFRHRWRRINYDLHHALGIWTLLIVSGWAVSAIYFAWDQPFTAAINAVSPLVGMREPGSQPAPLTGRPVSLQEVVAAAQNASPQGRLTYLFNPALTPGQEVNAYMNLRTPEDFAHADIVRLDAKTGKVLSVWHYGQNHSAGDWILWAMQPLHFGTLWGPWVRALWCGLGLSLAVLTVSGVLMYWSRYLRARCQRLVRI